MTTGIVFDIQRCALHDGPGLRTTVFLKGCPLRCSWCHNPESQKFQPEVGQSGKVYGRELTVEEVMETVLADRVFYESSGGGLTISGGEPTAQFEFTLALLQSAKAEGLHTLLDTSGQVSREHLASLLPWVDLFHYDWKITDPVDMLKYTGVNGEVIRNNLQWLREQGAQIILRCPIVPGVNDTEEHEKKLRVFESSHDLQRVERLQYHAIGNAKYIDILRDIPNF